MRRMIALPIAMVAAAIAGCAAPAEPTTNASANRFTISSGSRVYVLGRVESQSVEPIVTFDHTCSGVRYVHTIRDTIALSADGSARRAFTLEFKNGPRSSYSHLTASGTWAEYDASNVWYYRDAPSIVLTLRSDDRPDLPAYELPLRVNGAHELTTRLGLGGSCPGSPNDGREAEFGFTLR